MIAKDVKKLLKQGSVVVTTQLLCSEGEYVGVGATGLVYRVDDEGHSIQVDFGEQGLWWCRAYEIEEDRGE